MPDGALHGIGQIAHDIRKLTFKHVMKMMRKHDNMQRKPGKFSTAVQQFPFAARNDDERRRFGEVRLLMRDKFRAGGH